MQQQQTLNFNSMKALRT